MIKRELYMSRIRPFIGTDLIKVMTGIRRCGKSVMLELIKQELTASGISPSQFISINFEDMNYSHLQTAKALHDEITKKARPSTVKFICFLMKFRKYRTGKNVSTLFASHWTVTFISPDPMPSCSPVNWQPIWPDAMSNLSFIRFLFLNFWIFTALLLQMNHFKNAFSNIFCLAVCHIFPISVTLKKHPDNIFMIFLTPFS